MLVLSRKKNEGTVVTINGVRVLVTVLRIDGERTRLGFDAPPEVKILREELEEKAA